MYIETWQIYMIVMLGLSAYFSYKQGLYAGTSAGVQIVIKDLHEKGIIAIYKDEETHEIVVGRYDEEDFEEAIELSQDDEDDGCM
jgi:hypothetical protein